MSDFVAPRRARLKRVRSEVHGVSFAEQRLIEKALKESLKGTSNKSTSPMKAKKSPTPTKAESTCHKILSHAVLNSTVPREKKKIMLSSNKFGTSNTSKRPNVAMKSAAISCVVAGNSSGKKRLKLSYSKSSTKSQPQQQQRPKPRKQTIKDPIYRPHTQGPVANLPPKPRIERDSKVFTNIMLDLSTESDDDLSSSSQSSLHVPVQPSMMTESMLSEQSYLNEESEDVIVISESSSDEYSSSSTSSSSDNSTSSSSSGSSSDEDDVSLPGTDKILSLQRAQSITKDDILYMQAMQSDTSKNFPPGVKMQKILFKAVKKSSSVAPQAVLSRPLGSSVAIKQAKRIVMSRKPKPISGKPSHHKPFQASSVGLSDSLSWSSGDEESDDSDTSLAFTCMSTPTKDSDRSSFQAQRKFAINSSPSSISNGVRSPVIDAEALHSVPSTEDFLHFLCLRNTGAVLPDSFQVFNSPWSHSSNSTRSKFLRLRDKTSLLQVDDLDTALVNVK